MTNASRTSAEHFERAKAVLAGEPYSTSDRAVRKVVRSVDSFEGSNLWINREAFEMRWVNENRKRAHSFFLDLAPGLVLDLMSRMGVPEISTPTVGYLAPSRTQLAMLAGDEVDRVAWIIPGADEIRVMVRPLAGRIPPPPGPVLEDGPWPLPEPLPPWRAPEVVFVQFQPPLVCPHCAKPSESYRKLDDGSLICQQCGRSFDLEP